MKVGRIKKKFLSPYNFLGSYNFPDGCVRKSNCNRLSLEAKGSGSEKDEKYEEAGECLKGAT